MGHSAALWDRSELRFQGLNGIEQVALRVPRGASARVSLHGGQVTSWRNERGEELLFTSSKNKIWSIDNDPPSLSPNDSNGKVFVDLLLKPSEDELKCWPHCFEFRLRVSLSMDGDLTLISRIRNINGRPFNFSIAYHTYFSVSDISEIRIEGLETLDYLDNLKQRQRFTEQGDAITFESEVDRIYLGTPNVVAILDHEKEANFCY
ncbi:hypothetical protein HPP92_007443 [Vanilla planifolia]|uniref:Aldose 1-epimerase n=1 Tax=Vanilla planifolia TaxID=51239 RepID=A0A835RE27_VANPL|nr:hypothetical protein HPP92_007443 [Vanilla planifolia]